MAGVVAGSHAERWISSKSRFEAMARATSSSTPKHFESRSSRSPESEHSLLSDEAVACCTRDNSMYSSPPRSARKPIVSSATRSAPILLTDAGNFFASSSEPTDAGAVPLDCATRGLLSLALPLMISTTMQHATTTDRVHRWKTRWNQIGVRLLCCMFLHSMPTGGLSCPCSGLAQAMPALPFYHAVRHAGHRPPELGLSRLLRKGVRPRPG